MPSLPKSAIIVAVFSILGYIFQDTLIDFNKQYGVIDRIRKLTTSLTEPTVDCNDALQYLTTVLPVKGFHVVCLKKSQSGNTLEGIAYAEGMKNEHPFETLKDIATFRKTIETTLNFLIPQDEYAKKYKQPWAIFTVDGYRLTSIGDMVNKILFVFEGGQFIWPGIEIGHKTVVKNVQGHSQLILETVSMIPLVFSVEEFLKDEEIDVVMELSLPHLKPSGVTHIDGHEGRPATDWRTSTTYFLKSNHPIVKDINQRTEDLVRVPKTHQEHVQVLRYEKTQKYDAHTDYFPKQNHLKNPQMLELIEYGYRNRMITVFWYMSDVEEGGHTVFPRAGGLPQPASMKDCSKGLKVPPKKRKVIVFYSMLPNGDGDPMSLHGGCPVIKGTKYSGNKWIWNKPREWVE